MGFAVLDDVESYPVIRAKNKFRTYLPKNEHDCHVFLLTGKIIKRKRIIS